MSRKDFELIAAAIAESPALFEGSGGTRRALALDFADRLCATSDSFDPVRFVNSCGLSQKVEAEEVAEWTHSLRLRVDSLAARKRS